MLLKWTINMGKESPYMSKESPYMEKHNYVNGQTLWTNWTSFLNLPCGRTFCLIRTKGTQCSFWQVPYYEDEFKDDVFMAGKAGIET